MKKTIIVIAVVLVSALLLGVFATGSNLFGGEGLFSGIGYKYEVAGGKFATPDEYYGITPVASRILPDGSEVAEVSNLGNKFVLLYRLDEQHPSVKVYNADTNEVYFDQAIADLEGDYYGSCVVTGAQYTAISGCAEILGTFVYRETDTNFIEHFVKSIRNYKDSGVEEYPFAADLKLDTDKYYIAYLYRWSSHIDMDDIDFEIDGIEPLYYTTTKDDCKIVIFKPDSNKVTFRMAELNTLIQVYEVPEMADADWSPGETGPGEFDVTESSAGADVTTVVTTVPEGADLPQIDPGAPEGPG